MAVVFMVLRGHFNTMFFHPLSTLKMKTGWQGLYFCNKSHVHTHGYIIVMASNTAVCT